AAWPGWSRPAGPSSTAAGACPMPAWNAGPAWPSRTTWKPPAATPGCGRAWTNGTRRSRGTALAPAWSSWPAPAKLNLFLRITGRRPDGYHALQTVFRLLAWGDTVRLRVRDDGRIERHGASLPGLASDDDLAVRAAKLLQDEAN